MKIPHFPKLLTSLGASLMVFSLAGLPVVAAAPLSPDFTGCGGGTVVPVQNAGYEQQVLDSVNAERAKVSAAPLKRVTALDNAARYQSADLAQDNYFDHNTYDRVNGNLVYVCSWSQRISTFYPSPGGENIAAGYPTPAAAMSAWMNSSGHKANILNTGYWEIGIGYYSGGGSYGVYWTQDFGRRPGIYPLLINRDAATTDTRSVAIYVYGTWTQMRLHNDNDAPGAWQPFQNSFNWQLDPGIGIHTVTAELTNGSANTTSSDTIQLTADNTPILGGVPASTGFIYSMADHRLVPASLTIAPIDSNLGVPLTWSIASQGSWFSAAPTMGASPATFTITPGTFNNAQPGQYSGTVTVTITSPAGVLKSPAMVNLSLTVVAGPLINFYLPMIGN